MALEQTNQKTPVFALLTINLFSQSGYGETTLSICLHRRILSSSNPPEERTGVVQSDVEHSILSHTLPVHCSSKNLIHHLWRGQLIISLLYLHFVLIERPPFICM